MKVDDVSRLLLARPQDSCVDLLLENYSLCGESALSDITLRVASTLAGNEAQRVALPRTLEAGGFPEGRFNSAAGSGLQTTMISCFVQPIGDTLVGKDASGRPGITDALGEAAESIRRGWDIGIDFSHIRPKGAIVRGSAATASGPLAYMAVFESMCQAIESADGRQVAQMGILRIDHPDIEQFIDAKNAPGLESIGIQSKPGHGRATQQAFAALSQFSLSVAVSDKFMNAVLEDGEFDLIHEAPPAVECCPTTVGDDGRLAFVYRTVRARDLWGRFLRSAFLGADLGLVFIDRVNRDNNLRYVERLEACTPCAAQHLPPHGCCDLGSIMLQRFVRNPFTDSATFDVAGFRGVVHGMVDLLDTVLEKTNWPLPEQCVEARNKRRIGLGYLGLADAMAMLGLRYGSPDSVAFTALVGATMRDEAYRASIALAIERGPFPLFDAEKYLEAGTFASRLPEDIKSLIRMHGIRNSHLLSIGTTMTSCMAFGDNASSGIEPIFALRQGRTKVMPDGSRSTLVLDNSAYRLFKRIKGEDVELENFVTAMEISVNEHLAVLEAAAPFVDSGISKRVTVPHDYPFEDLSDVYMRAWRAGLKGITTHRPSHWPGAERDDESAAMLSTRCSHGCGCC